MSSENDQEAVGSRPSGSSTAAPYVRKRIHRTASVIDDNLIEKTAGGDIEISSIHQVFASTTLPPLTQNVQTSPSELPQFTEEDANLFKNSKLSKEILPYVFRKVLDWGCSDKKDSETYMEYLMKKGISLTTMKSKHRMFRGIIDQIKKETKSDTFDVTLIFSLVQLACEGIASHDDIVWKQEDETKIECLLKKAKQWRNDIAHEITTIAVSPETLTNAQETLIKLIKVAAKKYSRSDSELKETLHFVNVSVSNLKDLAMSDKEKWLIQVQRKLHEDGKKEMTELWKHSRNSKFMSVSTDIVDIQTVLHPITLEVSLGETLPQNFVEPPTIQSNELLKVLPGFQELSKILIVEGAAGSGKSTLINVIVQDFLGLMPNQFENLRHFDLLHFFTCRNQSVSTFHEYMLLTYPNTMRSVHVDDAVTAISNSKILHLIDGYDEINERSNNLVLDLLRRFCNRPDSRFVFTIRPHVSHSLKKVLMNGGLDYQTCSIIEIQQGKEQIEFLRRYENMLPNDQQTGMLEAFQSMPESVTVHFRYPINLVLFWNMYQHSPEKVANWTLEHNVLQETKNLCKNMATQRMQGRSTIIPNLDIAIDKLMDLMCTMALLCINRNTIELDKKTYHNCKRLCVDKINKDISWDEVLSCFLLTKSDSLSTKPSTYYFYHKSLQEYMAALALQHKLKVNKNKPLQDVLNHLVGTNVKTADFGRYENVMKFLITLLTKSDDEAHLDKRIREIVHIMNSAKIISFAYWSGVLVECSYHSLVVEIASRVVDVRSPWRIGTNELEAAIQLFGHTKPTGIMVHIPDTVDETPEAVSRLMRVISSTRYKGSLLLGLYSSYYSFKPCDGLLKQLKGSNCELHHFVGCLQESPGEQLAPLLREGGWLDLSLIDLKHDLHKLASKRLKHLNVRVDSLRSGSTEIHNVRQPLPVMELNMLCIDNLNLNTADWAFDLVHYLAPTTRKFDSIELDLCELPYKDVSSMRQELIRTGLTVSTEQGISKCREDWNLIIEDWSLVNWGVKTTYDDGSRNIRL